MDKYIILEENVVANVVIADQNEAAKHGWIPHPGIAAISIGWTYEDGKFSAPPINVDAIKKKFIMDAQSLLISSDRLVAMDLWETYSQQEKDNISLYRRQLREVPTVVGAENFDYENYTLPILQVN